MGHILNLSNFTKAFRYLKKNGLGAAFSAVEERILQVCKSPISLLK